MTTTHVTLRLIGVGVSAALALGTLAACGSNSDKKSSGSSSSTSTSVYSGVKVDAAARAKLPAKYRSALNVASDIPYPPMELFAKGKPAGLDVDLAYALGKKLGISKVEFEDQDWDSIIPSIQSGKHDIIMSSMNDTAEREKTVDFVDYFHAGFSIIVKKGNPDKITGVMDLCGKKVAVQTSTVQGTILKGYAPKCEAAGKKPIDITQLPQDSDAQNAVRAGKAVADVIDSQVAAYAAKTAGNGAYFQLVKDPSNPNGYDAVYTGIAVLKKDKQLTAALQLAMQSLVNDGTYAKILTKWGLSDFAVTDVKVNGAQS